MHSQADFLEQVGRELRSYRRTAEKALAQVDDEALFRQIDPGSNSLAVIARHVGGNLRSRFTDFLTTDGEKPDRHRDGEFENPASRAELMGGWQAGWAALEGTLQALTAADLARTVTIRDEPHTVVRALLRALAHVSLHVGQIVFLAKHLAGPAWQTLSIPRGQSQGWKPAPRG